jgi:hypothetical protein
MKIKWGALVVDGRGKIGGQVASKNRAGAYMRNKVTPVNPQTTAQLTARNRLTTFSQGWRGLTQAQRDAWIAAVSDFSRTDIFGDLKNPTGFNLYQRLNNNLVTVGASALTSPPLVESVGEVVANSLTAEDSTVAESLSLTLSDDVPANTAIKVFATAPQSPGKNFVKSEYRFIGYQAAATATPIDLLTDYQAKYGSTGTAGQKIFVKIQAVNTNTGQVGTPSEVSDIVEASS